MPYRVIFRRDARKELYEAIGYYERAEKGLGVRFKKAVDDAIQLILHSPFRFLLRYEDVRRVRVTVFPYEIYYRLVGSRIRILSVFHTSRSSEVWRARADEENASG